MKHYHILSELLPLFLYISYEERLATALSELD